MRMRDLTLADADMVLTWRNRREIADMMFTNEPIGPSDHARWMESVVESDTCKYWIVEHGERAVGVANLTDISPRHQRCAWAYYIAEPDTPGPVGLAVEFEIMAVVFADMGLEKLISEVLDFNEGVIRLHERLGFVQEGRLRQHVRRADGVYDVVVLSMLRSEWEARHAKRRRQTT